jgi:hypothetical protein
MRCLLLALGAAALAAAPPVSAQVLAQAVPAKVALTMGPGSTVARDVSIANLGDAPVVVRVRLADWNLSEHGDLSLLPPGTLPATLAGLVQFEPSEFSLQPGTSGWVHLTLSLPAAGPATRWGVLLSEVRPVAAGRPTRGPHAIAELGTTLYLTSVPPERAHADLVGLEATPLAGDSLAVAVRIRNPGERHVYVTGDVTLADSTGVRVHSGSLATGVVLPGGVRTLTWTCASPLHPGRYVLTATLDTGEPELTVGESRIDWPFAPSIRPLAQRTAP